MKLKIYGERNTGTNYVQRLIEKNCNIEILRGTVPKLSSRLLLKMDKFSFLHPLSELIRDLYFSIQENNNAGWKHMEVNLDLLKNNFNNDEIIYLCIVKNPYSWALSLYDKPYHQYTESNSLEFFLSKKWKCVKRENSSADEYKNIIKMWNNKVRSYLMLKEELGNNVLIIKYEDFLYDYTLLLDQLASLGVTMNDTYDNITKSTKEKSKDNNYYRDYYLNEKWKERLSLENIQMINNNLDSSICEKLNYEIL